MIRYYVRKLRKFTVPALLVTCLILAAFIIFKVNNPMDIADRNQSQHINTID